MARTARLVLTHASAYVVNDSAMGFVYDMVGEPVVPDGTLHYIGTYTSIVDNVATTDDGTVYTVEFIDKEPWDIQVAAWYESQEASQ